jgi:heat shock protein HslJ/membrane-bound inhibitor of C-type lysozyme
MEDLAARIIGFVDMNSDCSNTGNRARLPDVMTGKGDIYGLTRVALSTAAVCACLLLSGCSQDHSPNGDSLEGTRTLIELDNTRWNVSSIDGNDVSEQSPPSLDLKGNGELAGNTGCNAFFGRWSVNHTTASFNAAGVSLRACEPKLMEQERAFLDALAAVTTADANPDGTLSMLDGSSVVRLSLAPLVDEAAVEAPVPLDLPSETWSRFDCGEAGPLEFRFLGPETIEVMVGGERYIMPRQRAASGARYVGDGAEFWNKGDEALLVIGDRRYECRRVN